MQVWRICRRPFIDLSGEGARLFGGRWNSPGRPMIYTAESAALAILEVRVHLDLTFDLLPADYVLMAIDLGALPVGTMPAGAIDHVAYGDAWLARGETPLLRVPSAIVSEDFNILINPVHPDVSSVVVTSIRPFAFDKRLWKPDI